MIYGDYYKDDSLTSEITTSGTQSLPKYKLNVGDEHTYNVYFEVETERDFNIPSIRNAR